MPVDAAPRRGSVVADGQLGDRAARELARHLDGTLAEGPRTDGDGAAPVLEGAGEQLGRAHGAAVDEDDQGAYGVAARLGVEGALLAVHVVRGHQPAVEERGGGDHGLGDQPAGIAAEVEQHPGARGCAPDRVADLGAGCPW